MPMYREIKVALKTNNSLLHLYITARCVHFEANGMKRYKDFFSNEYTEMCQI